MDAVSGCDRSLRTADLTGQAEFQQLVDQELVLVAQPKSWVLMNDPYDPLTNFSEGNVLYLVDPEHALALAAGETSGTMTPDGPTTLVAIANDATIVVTRVHEYGMETGYPVVLGEITLPDGSSFPFEAQWVAQMTRQTRAR